AGRGLESRDPRRMNATHELVSGRLQSFHREKEMVAAAVNLFLACKKQKEAVRISSVGVTVSSLQPGVANHMDDGFLIAVLKGTE
ncbi:hypothetical protein BHE74_00048030, partial [Ensete ventricosum]